MKLSKFTLMVNDYPEKGEALLFNTRTQALIKINKELKNILSSQKSINSRTNKTQIKEYLNALKDNGIIIDDEENERDKLKELLRQLRYEPNSTSFEVTILTTYSCNFRCVYCFEDNVRENIFLDNKTSLTIINWLIRKAKSQGYKKIHLVFYGGEPLLNIRPIYEISWHIKDWTSQNNVEFGFSIITNGSRVTAELIDKFKTVGLQEIRISIDGDKQAHNKKRPFSNGKGSFDTIINNIKDVIDKVKVSIAGNFDHENVASIPRLLDYLEKEKLLDKIGNIGFAPLVPRLGPKNNPSAIGLKRCLSFLDKDGLFDEVVNIKREFLKRNIKIKPSMVINACPLIMLHGGITIDAEGIIYKCNSLLGYKEFSIGDVWHDEFNDNFNNFLKNNTWEKCDPECPYIPMCQGGCRFFSYLENNNFNNICCKKDYFDRICPELIKIDYEALTKESGKK